jgi:hypothetical protein
MIKELRVAQWVDGTLFGMPRHKWDLQFRRVGSTKWEPVEIVTLARKPKNVSSTHRKAKK